MGELLTAAKIPFGTEASRGFDHGTFVPMKVAWPDGEMPMVQLSLKRGLDAAEHIAIGRALAPLRDEGVLIVGSGNSFHNLRAFGMSPEEVRAIALPFDRWLEETVKLAAEERDHRLAHWSDAPQARRAHPREEHLLPLMVVAGAAGVDRGRVAFKGSLLGAQVSAHQFG